MCGVARVNTPVLYYHSFYSVSQASKDRSAVRLTKAFTSKYSTYRQQVASPVRIRFTKSVTSHETDIHFPCSDQAESAFVHRHYSDKSSSDERTIHTPFDYCNGMVYRRLDGRINQNPQQAPVRRSIWLRGRAGHSRQGYTLISTRNGIHQQRLFSQISVKAILSTCRITHTSQAALGYHRDAARSHPMSGNGRWS